MKYRDLIDSIEKLASLDAVRKKQYWQILKRLYGGADDAIKEISQSRDFGVYHSTKEKNIKSILNQGLRRDPELGNIIPGGPGIFFGNKDVKTFYGDGESVVRLKLPSELRNTKHVYPKPGRVMSLNLNNSNRSIEKTDTPVISKHFLFGPVPGQRDVNDIAKDVLRSGSNKDKNNLRFFGKLPGGESYFNDLAKQVVVRGNNIKPELLKQAEQFDNNIEKLGKQIIPELEEAFKDDPLAKEIAYMMATSHEYKDKPNIKGALALVKNYKWEKSNCKVNQLQGIDKPINEEKVKNIAEGIKKNGTKPLITVNQLHGIRPQTSGKRILLDGHHRLEALKLLGIDETPIYKGTYTGGAEKSFKELIKEASDEVITNIKEKDKTKDNILGGAAIGGGLLTIKDTLIKGHLTGRETFYHNTDKTNVASIKAEGLKASKALDPDNITNTLFRNLGIKVPEEEIANKVYLGKNKRVATTAGITKEMWDIKAKNPFALDFLVINDAVEAAKKNRENLKVKLPTWKFKEVINPEIGTAKNFEEYLDIMRSRVKGTVHEAHINDPDTLKNLKHNYDGLSKGTKVIEGDIGAEYIKGSKNYKGVSPKELKDYAKSNPGRFAKGVGLAGLGVGLIGVGVNKLIDKEALYNV